MDHLDFIKNLLDKGANVNARMKDNTERPDGFHEPVAGRERRDGVSARLPVERSRGDEAAAGARCRSEDRDDVGDVTALQVAAGIGWVEGMTYEWSEKANVEAVKTAAGPGRWTRTPRPSLGGRRCTAPGTKGRKPSSRCWRTTAPSWTPGITAMTGNDAGGKLAVHTWQPVDYADGLVRGRRAIGRGASRGRASPPQVDDDRGLEAPPMGRTLASVCITEICDVEEPEGQDAQEQTSRTSRQRAAVGSADAAIATGVCNQSRCGRALSAGGEPGGHYM